MKVDTTNFSLLPFILSNKKARLIVITGKGGVGKTTLSLATTKLLSSQNRKVLYNSFDQPVNQEMLKNISVNFVDLQVQESAQQYIAKKVGSTTVASWIMKTPFFKSLFNMLPGLGQMILLGNIINLLESDPELTIILDSPSSGHALTMLESPANFKEMFKTGLIVEDIERMQKFLFEDENLLLVTASLPSQMATVEAIELGKELQERRVPQITKVLNDSLSICEEIKQGSQENFPEFIKKKIELEEDLMADLNESDWHVIPHFSFNKQEQVIEAMVESLRASAKDIA